MKTLQAKRLPLLALTMMVVSVLSLMMIATRHVRAAANWYVSTTGSDHNAGTISSPLQTLNAALQAAASGDTIFVLDGIYSNFNNWITIDKDVTIQGLGNLAIFDVGGTCSQCGMATMRPLLVITQGHTVTIRKIIINGSGFAPHSADIEIPSGATVTVDACVFRNARPNGLTEGTVLGGSMNNAGTLTITNSQFENCGADEGGGVYNTGTLAASNTVFGTSSDSIQSGKGDGIYNAGMATISNCTFQDQLATIDGGAIYNAAGSSMKLTNCTLSGNSATTSGGGIYNAGTMEVNFCTVADNSAAAGGGIFNSSTGTLKVKNSIVADSTMGGDCANQSGGTFIALGKNFDTDGSGAALDGDFQQVTPAQLNLASLSGIVNGPPVIPGTYALQAGSVAIDAATDCTEADGVTPVNQDERGVFRCKCDVGAYEVDPPPDTTPPVAICQSITVTLNSAGTASITAAQIDNGSTDDCHVATRTVAPDHFTGANLGPNMVTLTVTDARGNTSTCTALVTVIDTIAPTINCANVAAQSASTNASCAATVPDVTALVRAQATDNDTARASLVITQSPAAGGTVSGKGSHPITVTVKDASSNSATCTVAFTLNDMQPPMINCPANQFRLTARPGDATGIATFSVPASDNCGTPSVVCVPPSGAAFPLGTTSVSCTATDGSGNTASCGFTITMFDVCLQDEMPNGPAVVWNSLTGDYRFCCGGTVYTGRASSSRIGMTFSLSGGTGYRLTAKLDATQNKGTATFQGSSGTCSITDRDIRNNTGLCALSGGGGA